MRRIVVAACLIAAVLLLGADGFGAFEAVGASPTQAPEGVAAAIVVEPPAATTAPVTRQAAPPSQAPTGDAMSEATRGALVIAAWILGILFAACVVAYVVFHFRRLRK